MSKFEQQRREKLRKMRDFQIDPYGGRFEDVTAAETAKAGFVEGQEEQRARCAGRIVLLRDIGEAVISADFDPETLRSMLQDMERMPTAALQTG